MLTIPPNTTAQEPRTRGEWQAWNHGLPKEIKTYQDLIVCLIANNRYGLMALWQQWRFIPNEPKGKGYAWGPPEGYGLFYSGNLVYSLTQKEWVDCHPSIDKILDLWGNAADGDRWREPVGFVIIEALISIEDSRVRAAEYAIAVNEDKYIICEYEGVGDKKKLMTDEIETGNATDGDTFKTPAMYGAGAETCPNPNCLEGWICVSFGPPPIRKCKCSTCHGLGVVAVKECDV